jgi:hypothetical protein
MTTGLIDTEGGDCPNDPWLEDVDFTRTIPVFSTSNMISDGDSASARLSGVCTSLGCLHLSRVFAPLNVAKQSGPLLTGLRHWITSLAGLRH